MTSQLLIGPKWVFLLASELTDLKCDKVSQSLITCTEQSFFGVKLHNFTLHFSFNELQQKPKSSFNTITVKADKIQFFSWESLLNPGVSLERKTMSQPSQWILLYPRIKYIGLVNMLEVILIYRTGVTLLAYKFPTIK
jgi:hypothetical protein